MAKPEIKAVIFDVGGVLETETLEGHYFPMCKKLGIDFKEFLKARKKYIDPARIGKITAKELIRRISKDFDIDYAKMLKSWIYYKRKAIVKDQSHRLTSALCSIEHEKPKGQTTAKRDRRARCHRRH